MHLRICQVFPPEVWDALAPQQQTLTDTAMNLVIDQEGMEALTVDRLEGIYELVTEHLWSSAFTAVVKTLGAQPAVGTSARQRCWACRRFSDLDTDMPKQA